MRDESPYSGRPVNLLLVEDNPGDIRLIEKAFRDAQLAISIHTVSHGDEALDFVYQRGEYESVPQPDLILLDWNLPATSGEEVLTEIKDDPTLSHIPVIVLSGSDDQEDVIKSYSSQANAYITKPIESEAFIDIVRSFEEFWVSVVRLPPTDEKR